MSETYTMGSDTPSSGQHAIYSSKKLAMNSQISQIGHIQAGRSGFLFLYTDDFMGEIKSYTSKARIYQRNRKRMWFMRNRPQSSTDLYGEVFGIWSKEVINSFNDVCFN